MSQQPALARSTGGRRYLWTVVGFALANAAVWIAFITYSRLVPVAAALPALKVERFAPGEGKTIDGWAAISWSFNADVGPAQPGPIAQPPGMIAPNLPGRWSWGDARTLRFSPDVDVPKATLFTLTLLPERLRTAATAPLAEPFVATVHTRPLEVIGVRHVGRMDGQPVLELSFSDVVSAAEVLKHVAAAGVDGKERHIQLHGEADGRIVRLLCQTLPQDDRLDGAGLTITVKPGLVGTGGPLGIETALLFPLNISPNLMATDAHAECPPSGGASIALQFNGDVETEALRQLISVEPAIPFTLNREYGAEVRLAGDFVPGSRYTIKIAKPPAGASAALPKAGSLSVMIPDRPRAVWFEHEDGYLGSQGNRVLLAHAVNVPAVRVSVYRVYDNNLVAWRNTATRRRYSSDAGSFSRPIANRRIDVSAPKNQAQDIRLALDDLLPAGYRHDGVYRFAISAETANASISDDGDDDFTEWYRRGGRGQGTGTSIVTLSDIGLSAKQGQDGALHAWAVSLSTGKPLTAVRLRLYSDKGQLLATEATDAVGLATLKEIHPAPGEQAAVLIADAEPAAMPAIAGAPNESAPAGSGREQLTWLDLRSSQTSFTEAEVGGKSYLRNGYEAFVYTDRGVYRPGETVHLRAIVRGGGQAIPSGFPLKWQFRRPDLQNWKSELTPLDADGAAGIDLVLPADLPTGRWTAQVGLAGDGKESQNSFGAATFQVEEYLPERIKAALRVTSAGHAAERLTIEDKKAEAQLQADYLFGRPAAQLATVMNARLEPVTFASPVWHGWTFGDIAGATETLGGSQPLGRRMELPGTALDAKGHVAWPLDLGKFLAEGEKPGSGKGRSPPAPAETYRGPWELTLAAGVREEGGRTVSTSHSVMVDGAPRYLGLHPAEGSPRAAEMTSCAVALVKPDGKIDPTATQLVATLYREEWNSVLLHTDGQYRYESTRKLTTIGQPITMTTAAGRATCQYTPPSGGRYVLMVRDLAAGVATSIDFYAIEPAWQENVSRENPEKIEMVLLPPLKSAPLTDLMAALREGNFHDAAEAISATAQSFAEAVKEPEKGVKAPAYRVGQRARVLVRSPFAGQLLLCVETDSVVTRRVIDMPASQMILPIDVTNACRPNAYVTATVIRTIDPNATWRAHRAFGAVRLALDSSDRKLDVVISAPSIMQPENSLTGNVHVTDEAGTAVGGAAVTVAAVDEGILQLTNFKSPDPLAYFLAPRALAVRSADLYGMLMPEVAKPKAEGGDRDGPVFGHGGNRRQSPISARRVQSVALFTGVLHTDAQGFADVHLPVPAFAGRLRLMAVAYTPSGPPRFGGGESETLVRSPVLVVSSWPRFAAPGDRFFVPLTIFNNSDAAGLVNVRLSVEGADDGKHLLQFPGFDSGQIKLSPMTLAAGAQTSSGIEVVVGANVGAARIHLGAEMNGQVFNESLELPIRPAAASTTDGGYVSAKAGVPAKIDPPASIVPGTRELQVRVTPWPTLTLPRGLDYLDRYPYGCLEQTTSTAFPLVYLGEIGQKLAPGMFDRERVADKVQVGVLRLMSMQTSDGGLAMWPGGRQAWPWGSVYAAHFLLEAQAAGHAVPEDFRDRLLGYCRGLLQEGGDAPELLETQAYACYVLATAGKPPRPAMARLSELLAQPKQAAADAAIRGTSARWHLATAWLAAGRRDLALGLLPAVIPRPSEARALGGTIASPLRDQAIELDALLAIDPGRAEVAALAQEVGERMDKSNALNTQEVATALCALGHYLRQSAAKPAYETVELWAGDQKVASAANGKPLSWDLPKDRPLPKDLQVRVAGKPEAQAFVSWVQNGVPMQPPPPADSGMKVRRRFLDATGNELKQSQLVSGDLLQVELTLSAEGALQNVVIADLLPAGVEVENPKLQSGAVVAAAQEAKKPGERPNPIDILHTDMRDDRVVVVANLTSGGTGTIHYLARAVAPGSYVIPPARAECMYDSGINSTWGGGQFNVLTAAAARMARTE